MLNPPRLIGQISVFEAVLKPSRVVAAAEMMKPRRFVDPLVVVSEMWFGRLYARSKNQEIFGVRCAAIQHEHSCHECRCKAQPVLHMARQCRDS